MTEIIITAFLSLNLMTGELGSEIGSFDYDIIYEPIKIESPVKEIVPSFAQIKIEEIQDSWKVIHPESGQEIIVELGIDYMKQNVVSSLDQHKASLVQANFIRLEADRLINITDSNYSQTVSGTRINQQELYAEGYTVATDRVLDAVKRVIQTINRR